MPLIFLSALTLEYGYEKIISTKNIYLLRSSFISTLLFLSIISPTFALRKELDGPVTNKWRLFDSALVDMFFAGFNRRLPSPSVWFPGIYLPSAELIMQNSREGEIIYSPHYIVGVCLASLSERPTANRLLAEVIPTTFFDPFVTSKIIILLKDEKPRDIRKLVGLYKLVKIGENDAFLFYKNPACESRMSVSHTTFPFWAVWAVGGLVILLFLVARKR